MANNDTKLTPTNILNRSYDPALDVIVTEIIGADGVLKNPATEAKQDDIISAITGSAGLVPDSYDYVALTYVSAGNGIGEIETATYKTGGSGGTTVAVLTLAYDANSNLTSVTKV